MFFLIFSIIKNRKKLNNCNCELLSNFHLLVNECLRLNLGCWLVFCKNLFSSYYLFYKTCECANDTCRICNLVEKGQKKNLKMKNKKIKLILDQIKVNREPNFLAQAVKT